VPSPVTRELRFTSYHVPETTGPKDANGAGSAAGALVQLTVASVHEVLAVRKKVPPTLELLEARRRSFALETELVPIPATVNFNKVWNTGLLSTWSLVAPPKLAVGRSARTWASAAGANVSVLAAAAVAVSPDPTTKAARSASHRERKR
jgi:hypothetical protein